jgi:hypothetical protein
MGTQVRYDEGSADDQWGGVWEYVKLQHFEVVLDRPDHKPWFDLKPLPPLPTFH